ncbi:SHOCT domain-containing protein [Desulfatitalea alkaliphila]|uniref:SHOCT domain-containing protein n=1 Tax=Desulfatitalea alkaliphila TaxID=2929485 RepID=A0AA41UJX0_9BACT|nr:SHOCT domain-containing protein [Desulfatitalea alkaliphila]MCJ8501674.1 SHOCT domain-containing protein [Desulfatitalea alkaliphila]
MKSKEPGESLFKGVLLAHLILVLHFVLLAVLVVVVFFFGWLVTHLFWIIGGLFLLISLSAYLFYRRLRREGRSLREAMHSPLFAGRSVEIHLLGGMASLRVGPPTHTRTIAQHGDPDAPPALEDPEVMRIREIAVLADLLDKELISPEEFDAAKQKILGRGAP